MTKAELQAKLKRCQESVAELETHNGQLQTLVAAYKKELDECKGSQTPTPPSPEHAPWRPYNSESLWNTPIAAGAPGDPNSVALVNQLKADRGSWNPAFSADDWYSHPVYWAKASDPWVTVTLHEDWGTNIASGYKFQIPATAKPERGSDHHLTVIQPDGMEWSLWNVDALDIGAGRVAASSGGKTPIGGTGTNGYATAFGSGGAAGNITGEELQAGSVRHALFAVSGHTNGQRKNGAWSQGSTSSGPWPAMGQRFQLTGYTPTGTKWIDALLEALKVYGLIIGDTGGGFLKGESPLPYTTVGKPVPLKAVRADGIFPALPIDWTRMRALA